MSTQTVIDGNPGFIEGSRVIIRRKAWAGIGGGGGTGPYVGGEFDVIGRPIGWIPICVGVVDTP